MHFWEIQLLNIDLCLCQMVSQLGSIEWFYFLIQTFNSSLLLSRFKRTFNTHFSRTGQIVSFPLLDWTISRYQIEQSEQIDWEIKLRATLNIKIWFGLLYHHHWTRNLHSGTFLLLLPSSIYILQEFTFVFSQFPQYTYEIGVFFTTT